MKKISSNLFSTAIVALLFMMNYSSLMAQKEVQDFKLQNTDGNFISLSDYPKAKGFIIVFTCNHCPFAKLYPSRLNDLSKKYESLGVPLIAVSSTDTSIYEEDSYDKMIEKSGEEHFVFPYLYDNYQAIAKNFKAEKTPHAFVIWKLDGKWMIKYSGAIDDNGASPTLVQQHFVADAVDALLKGKAVKVNETKSLGCQIHFRN